MIIAYQNMIVNSIDRHFEPHSTLSLGDALLIMMSQEEKANHLPGNRPSIQTISHLKARAAPADPLDAPAPRVPHDKGKFNLDYIHETKRYCLNKISHSFSICRNQVKYIDGTHLKV
jgi:hypothetical protein